MDKNTKEREIAIISGRNMYNYDDLNVVVAKTITDWKKVSEDDIRVLQRYLNTLSNDDEKYTIIYRVDNNGISSLISECVAKAKEYNDRERKAKEEKERKRKEYQDRKEAKVAEKEKALLKKLQKKYGDNV